MNGQNREGVDQQLIQSINPAVHLLLRTVLGTQETGTLGNRLGVNLGTRRSNAGRIPLGHHGKGVGHQLTGLHTFQVTIALAYLLPNL